MNEEQARALDMAVRAMTYAIARCGIVAQPEKKAIRDARAVVEGMLAEGFRPCPRCGEVHVPALDGPAGWAVPCPCKCVVTAEGTLDALRDAWNKGGCQ